MKFSKIKTIGIIAGAGLFGVLALLTAQIVNVVPAAAALKVCAAHQGVNCSAGAAYDGSVVCNDGSRDGAFKYSSVGECKAPFLRCPIFLAPDALSAQKKAVQTIIDALVADNKKVCNDNFNTLESLNKQMAAACKSGSCQDNQSKTAAYDKANLGVCLHVADDAVAKYKTLLNCLAPAADPKSVTYGHFGFQLAAQHPAFSGACAAYGSVAVPNAAKSSCSCPDAWEWSANGKYCVQSLPCEIGSERVGGACVTYTKICMNKYGASAYSVSLNGKRQCQCGIGYKWNKDQTACVAN